MRQLGTTVLKAYTDGHGKDLRVRYIIQQLREAVLYVRQALL